MERREVIVIKNLEHEFDDRRGTVTTFKNINFKMYENEFVSLIGPSGCGKSTLLRVIAGLIKPREGEVYLEGKKVEKPSRKIAFVFQHYALYPWLTVFDNVAVPLRLRKEKEEAIRSRVKKMIKSVGLAGFETFYPISLSGGMKQRVALARAFVTNPTVLFMDEPFSALDYLTAQKMYDEVLKIWRKFKCTAIMVSHNIKETLYLSDRMIVLSKLPAHIVGDIKIKQKRPRNLKSRSILRKETLLKKLLKT